jgi:AraC-like DNA-binding protein
MRYPAGFSKGEVGPMNATQLADYLHKSSFSISFAGNTLLPAGAYKEPYVHSLHSIHYIVSGKGTYIMNRVEYPLEAGNIMLFVPDTLFEWSIPESEAVEIYHFRFDYQLVYKEKQEWLSLTPGTDLSPLRGLLTAERSGEIRLLFEKVYHLWKAYDPVSQYKCNLAFRELWLSIIENMLDRQYWSDTDSAIKFTCEYMTKHFRSSLTVEQLAKMAGISTGYYSREFKRLFGLSPKEFIIHLRVNKAKELLGSSEYPLTEVSKMVGYGDEFYFSRIFKRVTGITPSLYAKQSKA